MFVGRRFELEQLNKLYCRGGFQLVIMSGRRKVGKTALIKEFCRDKATIYYLPEENDESLAFKSFKELIVSHFNIIDTSEIKDWEDALKTICEQSSNRQFVLVLDEFSYAAKENPALPSIIKKVIEHCMKDSQIFLIICGSSNSFMEKELLSPNSALYGLRTSQFKIEPLNFFESSEFFPNTSIVEKINYFSTLGGIPQYLLQFDYSKSYEYNIMEFILDKSTYLYNEPESYLKCYIEDINFAHNLLSILSKGDFNLERFDYKNMITSEDLIIMLKKLREVNIISRNRSIGHSIVRPWSYYRLEDNYFRFWYRFVYKNHSLIDMNMKEYLFQNKIKKDLSSHVGYVFEDICIEFLKICNSTYKLPFVFESIGSWVGYNPLLHKPSQLDIVAIACDNALIGECKWNTSPVGISTIDSLIEKSKNLKYNNKYYCLFSKSGYDKEATALVLNRKDILLFTLEDIKKLL